MVRFQNSCSSFCTSLRGQYSLRSISFSASHVRELAAGSPIVWTCPFHHVRAASTRVHAAYLTLQSAGQELIAKTDSVFSNHRVSSITPPIPEKDFGLQFMKSLYEHGLGFPPFPPLSPLPPLPFEFCRRAAS